MSLHMQSKGFQCQIIPCLYKNHIRICLDLAVWQCSISADSMHNAEIEI